MLGQPWLLPASVWWSRASQPLLGPAARHGCGARGFTPCQPLLQTSAEFKMGQGRRMNSCKLLGRCVQEVSPPRSWYKLRQSISTALGGGLLQASVAFARVSAGTWPGYLWNCEGIVVLKTAWVLFLLSRKKKPNPFWRKNKNVSRQNICFMWILVENSQR